ncbi:hypothetical protein ODJ79_09035 [Actinoplanes sp. KI2]|uniref:hypothetical protein n=1 Tax=Actinoplanes sp. KI2 TaxID=2983315 RepID=UPI0021D5E4B8|nr:hypothetical protein [Actinoplanes sp. KI2]MCU7723856.1 hypothetical protein [Actinoplanes sp. KI2]
MNEPRTNDHEADLAQLLAATTATAAPPTTSETALAALITLRHLRDQLDAWEPQLIAAARAAGASWADLAPALGVASRQAAERRYLRVRRSAQDDAGTTGDQRVTAERDRRAGTRAVADWARAHSADLRRLAGQITALTDLEPHAQPSLDRLHHALGDADPAALLPLLAAARQHLDTQHPALAEQIATVSHQTDQLRQATQQQREHHRDPGLSPTGRPDITP